MPAVKTYTRVNFQNYPSTSTPLNATNLNKMDKGIDDLDDEVVTVKNAIENMSFDANAISYDNTQSGLQATDVQGAVDEINDNLTDLNDNIIKTIDFSNLITSLTVTITSSYYTATQDCYINGRLDSKGGVGDGYVRYVDDNNNGLGWVVGIGSGIRTEPIGIYFNKYIKAGTKIELVSATTQIVKVYGVKVKHGNSN